MDFKPIKTWSYPAALLDALQDTRRAVAEVVLPLPTGAEARANEVRSLLIDQLDQHLIPRLRDSTAPAIFVVGGPTGAGKSTIVNALLGEELTASGVLRPTTKVPHVFHHPLDRAGLPEVALRATVQATESVPRGLAVVDSPDLDSVRDENRAIAHDLIEAADLWIFTTTPARYGDSIPWEALRRARDRGASVAIVLNRTTPEVVGTVRRDLVDALAREQLSSLPLFVIPENEAVEIPRDVVGGLGRWLNSVAAASAATIVERTLHGAVETVKDWLDELGSHMDEQAAAAKTVRAEVRRCAAQAELQGGDAWYAPLGHGPVAARWAAETSGEAALAKLDNSVWSRRRSAREARDAALHAIGADLIASVEAAIAHAATTASTAMASTLAGMPGSVGLWLAQQRDPRDARVARERRAADSARTWIADCASLASALPGAQAGEALVGRDGLGTMLASAALGVDAAARALIQVAGGPIDDAVAAARLQLTALRHHVIQREALDMMRPTDVPSLSPDASAKIGLRRAELRALL